MHPTTLYWLRQDLRVADNPALTAALQTGNAVAVYILEEDASNPWPLGGAARWWLHHSLVKLQPELAALGVPLILRRGVPAQILPTLMAELNATHIHWGRLYEPFTIARDSAIKSDLQQRGMSVTSHNTHLLHEPWEVANKTGGFYKVYTPFSKACFERGTGGAPLPIPKKQAMPSITAATDSLADWRLLPSTPDWAGGLRATWQPGSTGAYARLHDLCARVINHYAAERDRPDVEHTSRLSPHLRFGEISARQIWHAVEATGASRGNVEKYVKELLWREFSYHLLYHAPHLPHAPFDARFANFPWQADAAALQRWQRGQTGYPIVDAGMRQLWQTGWMHNRVRMIVASFLVKHMLQPWQHGAAWFWDTLVDADLASNSASWQWVAGCGADAAPYFRIFNPILQGVKFDANGDYVRRYVPELAHLPAAQIHTPWELPSPPQNYPKPIIEHTAARDRALAAYSAVKEYAEGKKYNEA